jgi:hypothetical protein
MQLFSFFLEKSNIFFAHENMKKPLPEVAHNRPLFFLYCQPAQVQPKSHFLLHKNVSLLYNDFDCPLRLSHYVGH